MKYFKLKSNFFSNLLKKLIIIKKINLILENTQNTLKTVNIKKKLNEIFNKFYEKKFKLNYFIFFFSLAFFYYLIYLSFPGILYDKNDQNYLTKLLKEQYGLEFALTPEINYSILPKPHFQVNDVIIFNNNENFQKEIAQVKKIKIYLFQKNFLKKKKLKIKSIELFETNFFINKLDLDYLNSYLNKGFKKKPIIIKRANLFYQDLDKGTILFLNLKKTSMLYNNKTNDDILSSEGKIFNVPFSILWKQNQNKTEKLTNLKFKKIKLNILNSVKLVNEKKINKLQINLNRSKYIMNYDLKDKKIKFNSNNSFIGNNKFIYSGKIFLDPFNFYIKSTLDKLKINKLILDNSFLKEVLSKDFVLNENFNGKIDLIIKNLENNPLFDNLNLNVNFKGQVLDFSNSTFSNEKIANLIVKKGKLYEDKNNIIFKGNLDFVINDINKLHNKFVVPKKNRNDIKKIKFELIFNLTNNEIKILNIINDNFKNNEIQEIDELIYEFNSGNIKISNWIEFKIFANKIISSYSG